LRYFSADTTCITMDRASLSGIVLCCKKPTPNSQKVPMSEKSREKTFTYEDSSNSSGNETLNQ